MKGLGWKMVWASQNRAHSRWPLEDILQREVYDTVHSKAESMQAASRLSVIVPKRRRGGCQ